jgi:1-deoxy-D-xylulose-5-phosphate reductoisomerase
LPGHRGLDAVLAAIDAGKTIALANKEILVMAGAVVMDARRRGRRCCPSTASTTPSTSACTGAPRRTCGA